MKITKLYLSGGYNFEITFDINGDDVEIKHYYDNRTDSAEKAITTISHISEIVGNQYFDGLENLKNIQLSMILNALHKEGLFKEVE